MTLKLVMELLAMGGVALFFLMLAATFARIE